MASAASAAVASTAFTPGSAIAQLHRAPSLGHHPLRLQTIFKPLRSPPVCAHYGKRGLCGSPHASAHFSFDEIRSVLRQELQHNPSLFLALEYVLHQNEQLQRDKEELRSDKNAILASMEVELLRCKGLNNARGLFENLQDRMAKKNLGGASHLKGTLLWEAILNKDQDFRLCIEQATKVKDVLRQATAIYTVFSVLSQHMHEGNDLQQLVATDGAISFERGQLSPEQVNIFICLGQHAGVKVVEEEGSNTRLH